MTPRITIIAASPDIVGGQGVQARSLVEALEGDGYDVRFLPIDSRFPRGLGWVRGVRGLRTLVNELIYVPGLPRIAASDVVHVFSASYWSFLLAPVPAMIAARFLNKRVVLHYHSGEADDHLARWGVLVHPWLRLAHAIVVPSEYLRSVFAHHGYAAQVIPNVVDVARFRYRVRAPLRPRLLSTRNLEPYYRVDLVIEAFARFRAVEPRATLTIAGYGSEESRLRALAESSGGAAIQFVGKVDPSAMPRLYADHDIFVNASTLDNQPVSILEAFAAGLPVVSSDAGDIPAMVRNDETGLLAPAGDAAALSDRLRDVWRDPDAAVRRARRARRGLAAFTWPSVRDRWADVYGQEGREWQGRPHPALRETRVDEVVIAADPH